MKAISHRGNICGKEPNRENTREYVEVALSSGYEVEIDVRFKDGSLWLGHDGPEEVIDLNWLFKNADRLWIHCKDIQGIMLLREIDNGTLNYFGHANDDFVLTSRGFLFCLPTDVLNNKGVLVMPEFFDYTVKPSNEAYAVLTDFPETFKGEDK